MPAISLFTKNMEQSKTPLAPMLRLSPSANVVSEHFRVVGLVVYSVIIFIFSFATASAWVAAATQAIRFEAHAKHGANMPYNFGSTHMAALGSGNVHHKTQGSITKIAFIFTSVLTVVTLGLAIGFAFASKSEHTFDISGSSSSLIQNIYKHVENSEKKMSSKVVVPVVPVLKQDENGSTEEIADITPVNITIPIRI